MTTYPAQTVRTTRQHRTALVGALTFLVAVGLPITGILTADMREVAVQPSLIDWIFVAAIATITLLTFGSLALWLRRTPQANRAGVGLVLSGIAAAASVVAFWTMVPVALGSAGAWLGALGRIAANESRTSTAKAAVAVVLGTLAALASVVMYVATS